MDCLIPKCTHNEKNSKGRFFHFIDSPESMLSYANYWICESCADTLFHSANSAPSLSQVVVNVLSSYVAGDIKQDNMPKNTKPILSMDQRIKLLEFAIQQANMESTRHDEISLDKIERIYQDFIIMLIRQQFID